MYHFATALVVLSVSLLGSPCMGVPNSKFILSINKQQSSWLAGTNFRESSHRDMRHLTGVISVNPDPNFRPPRRLFKTDSGPIPESFDARDQWPICSDVIGKIRNQGNCSASWAFSTVEVMSDRLCIATKGAQKFIFSPEDLMTCCPNCGLGCNGGYTSLAWLYWNDAGIVSGGDYNSNEGCKPYSGQAFFNSTTGICKSTCINSTDMNKYYNYKRFGTGYYAIDEDVRSIQREIMASGPVQASLIVYEDFLNYQKGIYYHISGNFVGYHAVKILGWGTDGIKSPYWLVANSWGSKWGLMGGLFKIRRGNNECEIEKWAYAGDPNIHYSTPSPTTPSSSVKHCIFGSFLFICLSVPMMYSYFPIK